MGRPAIVTVYKQKSDGSLAMLIPKEIQEKLRIEKGTRLMTYEEEGKMVCETVDDDPKR